MSPTTHLETSKWKLPAIIGGAVTGAILVFVVVGACIFRKIRLSRAIKHTQAQNTSPNHVVLQVISIFKNTKY